MNTADYFNRMAEKWDTMFKTDTGVINHILDKADIEPDNIILDCGTGTGILIPYYAERLSGSGWVDAYDISTGMLNKAHEKYADTHKARFILGDIEHDSLFGAYDRIVMFCMLPHLDNPVAAVARLVDSNLMPGGKLLIGFSCSKEKINSCHRDITGMLHSHFLDSAEELAARLHDAGLTTDYIEDNDTCYIIRVTKQ